MTQPRREDPGGEADVLVAWVPGRAGDLVGTCRCGARFSSPDPTAVWNWYAAHGHGNGTATSDAAAARRRGRAGPDIRTSPRRGPHS